MDDADRAQQLEAMQIDEGLRATRVGRSAGQSRLTCAQCGEGIPEGRRLAARGCELCVECQERLEEGMGR